MDRNLTPPDYELADRIALTEPSQVKAIGHPLRTAILGLLHERAATVNELAVALGRPKSTVAHHVNVLTRARLLQVVRTRRVRAIEERFYGRTAHTIVFPDHTMDGDLPFIADARSQEAREVEEGRRAQRVDVVLVVECVEHLECRNQLVAVTEPEGAHDSPV